MGKTFKDRKNYPKPRREGREPLSSQYVAFMQNGANDIFEEFEEQVAELGLESQFKFDPGDFCPDCGTPTDFDYGHLCCRECGWIHSDYSDYEDAA